MASTPVMIAAGATLAGLGGVAGAAMAPSDGGDAAAGTTTAKPRVEVRTEVVRKVEHRVRRMKPKRHAVHAVAPAAAAASAPASAVAPAPVAVVHSQPVSAPPQSAPVRTRASGGGSGHGGDDGHESEREHEGGDD